METMQENISDAMGDLTAQISLIKSALDNMAGQLDEQGVALEGIDKKIDQIDGKLDRAHEMLKKISRQLTGNRMMMLVVAETATAIILNKLVL
jgi:methyl-accepting chemotaxis protein